MLGCRSASSIMVPIALNPPTVSGTVSFASLNASFTVGTLTLKLVTPAGTLMTPLASVTPLVNVTPAALISAAEAVPPLLSVKL